MQRRPLRFVCSPPARLLFTVLPALLAATTPVGAEHRDNAFDLIGEAPAEAKLIIASREAEWHREQFAELPIAAPAEGFLRQFQTYSAYVDLLRGKAALPGEAFDRLLGREILFVSADERAGTHWALCSVADSQAIVDMLTSLGAKPRQKQGGIAMFTIENGRFLVGQKADRWLLAPAAARAMFDRCLPLLSGEEVADRLNETEVYRQARFVGRGDTAYLRIEDAERNAYTACVIRHWRRRIEADLAIQSPALRDDLGELPQVETDVLQALSPRPALAIVEPFPDRSPRTYQLLRDLLPKLEIDPQLRPQLGPRMAFLVEAGEAPAVQLFWCLEVRSCAAAEPALDTMVAQALKALELRVDAPREEGTGTVSLRTADLTRFIEEGAPAVQEFLGGGTISLGWQTFAENEASDGVAADEPGWWVIGIPSSAVGRVGAALIAGDAEKPRDKCFVLLSEGTLRGGEAAGVVGRLPLPVLQSLAELLAAVEDAHWQLQRTSDSSIEATVRVKLCKDLDDARRDETDSSRR